jgi:DNA polymerase-3 subunit gamma/tau
VTTALYRRYRPETFAEVIGQEQVTTPLSTALAKNRVNHAYLFSGPRGCGKTTSARILARCLNCVQGPAPVPCGTCDSCVELSRGGTGSLDVVEIDAASHGGVDDARDLRERAAFAPIRDRYKVFIIDEAHMVSPQGFNALLKIVEEPPEHIRFIFATTEPDKVIGTIRSRTHHYPFRLVPPERLTNYLAELCEREGVTAGKGVLPLVIRAGAGSVRDSLSVLDQLIGGAGPEGLTYQTAIGLLGYTDGALLDDAIDGLAAGDGGTVFRVIDRVIESGHDARRFVEDLLERLRDLLVVDALRDGGHAVFRGLPDDQLERMRGQASRFGAAELSRAADVTNSALTDMTGATSPRLQLELLCARLLLPAADDGNRGLGARIDRLEKRINLSGGVPSPAPAQTPALAAEVRASAPGQDPRALGAEPEPTPAPLAGPETAEGPPLAEPSTSARSVVHATQPDPPGGAADLEAVRRMWAEVLNTLARLKRTTWSLISQYAQVLDYDGRRLLIGFDSPGRAASFSRGAHQDFLRQALIEVIGLDCAIEATGGDTAPAQLVRQAPAAAPAQRQPQRQQRQRSQPASASEPAPVPEHRASSRAQRSSATPYDDVPPNLDEPPPVEDEVPPDDGRGQRSSPASRTARATAPAPAPSRPEPKPELEPEPRPAPTPEPRREVTPALQPEPAVVLPQDDVISVDDVDLDSTSLVGMPVVEQLLGGKVIEEIER